MTCRLHHSRFRSSPGAPGFSLIEVTMALGIVAFAFMAVISLLPIGLGRLRDAVNTTVQAQIVQAVSARASVGDVAAMDDLTLYFDDQAMETVAGSETALYEVRTTVAPSVQVPGDGVNERIKALTVSIRPMRSETTWSFTVFLTNREPTP
jgi:uncharacterized protein (TIGR02598 family)